MSTAAVSSRPGPNQSVAEKRPGAVELIREDRVRSTKSRNKQSDAPANNKIEDKPPTAEETMPSSPPPANQNIEPGAAQDAWTQAEINSARDNCLRLIGRVRVEIEPLPPMKAGFCGAPSSVQLNAIGGEHPVVLAPPQPLTCPMVVALHDWIGEIVQPIAMAFLGERIARLEGLSSYQCRNRVGNSQSELSEHALANGVDISSFVTTSGRRVQIARSWGATARDPSTPDGLKTEPEPKEPIPSKPATDRGKKGRAERAAAAQESKNSAKSLPIRDKRQLMDERNFLRAIHQGACKSFATVLGPEANEAHRDHFHLDMADRRSGNAFCE